MNTHQRKISVVGLGYVGLPVAVAFGRHDRCIGFDINLQRIAELMRGEDSTLEITPAELNATQITFTADANLLKQADFHIVAVPTPIDSAKRPDMTPVLRASETVGRILKAGDIVVYESTVYPGATEEDCVPVLEKHSGLRCGYESVVTAGVHRAASIKVAEAAKVIENTQRDLNIALMNELALIFQRLGIDTRDVLAAAGTKWNFLKFDPGLVGGHCIGVDPYYLTHRAQIAGYIPEVILAGRSINDNMGRYVAQQTIKRMIQSAMPIHGSTVTVLGFTFKEDVPDLRNTRVIDIIEELRDYGVNVQIHDPSAYPAEAHEEYGIELLPLEALQPAHAVILAVPHRQYLAAGWAGVTRCLLQGQGVVTDVKGKLDRTACPAGVLLWRL